MSTTFITVGEKKLPVKFGMNALSDFCEHFNMSITEMQEKFKPSVEGGGLNVSLKHAIHLCYVGLKHGHRKEKIAFEMTVEDVGDLMDESADFMGQVLSSFGNSMTAQSTESVGE